MVAYPEAAQVDGTTQLGLKTLTEEKIVKWLDALDVFTTPTNVEVPAIVQMHFG